MMRNASVFAVVLCFCGVFLSGFTGSYVLDKVEFESAVESTVVPSYDRIDEVKKHCGSVLSSATDLKPGDSKVYNFKDEFSFMNGDWRQDVGEAPIVPYVDRIYYRRDNFSDGQTPLKLASFWVTDVDYRHKSKKSVSINGVLVLGITLDSLGDRPYGDSHDFRMWPGHTQLSISFQGVYVESKKNNGGERIMCLLGSTMLPSRESDSSDPWEWAKGSGSNYNQPPLLQDDQILLVLRFPMSVSLTNRVIQGEVTSLNPKANLKYFDQVHILSQVSNSANYEFGSEKFVSKACNPYPSSDTIVNGGFDVYKGTGFCEVLGQITGEGNGAFTIVPNWKCNGTNDFCSKLGPFMTDQEIKATNGSFKGVQLLMQNIKCEQTPAKGNVGFAKVAAVFRAVRPLENQYVTAMRSGPSNLTIAAEGIWKSSSGQLCMVGCLGLVDTEGSSCNSRICLYIPMSFSIRQRGIIVGSFSSTDEVNASYFPLSFEKLVRPMDLWNYFRNTRPYYSYSKLEKAGTILERNEPFSLGTVIKKSLLQFPKLEDAEEFIISLSLLSEDLTLQTSAFPDPLPSSRPGTTRTDFGIEILSIGPLFGREYWLNASFVNEETPYHSKAEYTQKQVLLNVSAQITLYGAAFSNFSTLFVEGLYDPHVGKMYLVGCRDVRASWNILLESMDLEAGLDCLSEVIVSYPPTTSRWLVDPTARVSISSQRNDDDPLHFNTVRLQTLPIMYRRQREDILSRRGIEGILRILTLSFAIVCILSQLFYIKHDADSAPLISLVMLGVQALGYCLPLITGAEALFKRMSPEAYESSSFGLEKNQWVHVIDNTVKLLVMVSFLLTLRLCQKVWKSRIRLLTRSPHEPCRVPSDKKVFFVTLAIHVIGYVIVLIIHSTQTRQKPFKIERYSNSTGIYQSPREWETELEEYGGLVQDFFLLPQVIGNILWQIDCQPLKNLYFIGITIVRLLPHVYDYIRSPVPNPYFADEYEFVNPNTDFFSKFGDIAIPCTAIFLAAAVYVQQRWNYEKLSQCLIFRQCRLLPLGSRMYQRLSSKSFEAELASDTNRDHTLETQRDSEE
ncbi:uncharacterized protein LOC126681239 [Mercurialis annua]|uniref:uncharacterized protein LOC126681239 n=1 Tax=Mercurialis annua TaxID=3986 RepID=UPI00215E866F|nr:uncharacterized protein LOC126681239 [Mercurialis annua]